MRNYIQALAAAASGQSVRALFVFELGDLAKMSDRRIELLHSCVLDLRCDTRNQRDNVSFPPSQQKGSCVPTLNENTEKIT
jgi:hypothetical protein